MRYQHVTFRKLAVGEEFFTKKFRYTKSSFFTGRMILDGELVFVSPWRKVRSTRLFGKPTVSHSVHVCSAAVDGANAFFGRPSGADNVCCGRPPVAVTPGGDRTPETIGGNEKCPSA